MVRGTSLRGSSLRTAIPVALVGWLVCVELVSGMLQGYYVTISTEIARHLSIADAELNWFEAGQLLLSALMVPVLAKLGDMHGHKRMLLVSTIAVAGASWWMAFAGDFWSYLIAFSLQGVYAVWLPLEIALIFDRGRRTGRAASETRRAAGLLVVGLETGAILGALGAARAHAAFGEAMVPTLLVPAVFVTLLLPAIWFGVPESEPLPGRSLDAVGFSLLALSLLTVTSGLTFLRLMGAGSPVPWILVGVGLLLVLPFGRWVLRRRDPAIDLRRARRRDARRRGRCGTARADGRRHGPHEHDEDDRRLVRVVDLRDRARCGRRGHGGVDRRLRDGLDRLRRDGARRGSRTRGGAPAGVRRPRARARCRRGAARGGVGALTRRGAGAMATDRAAPRSPQGEQATSRDPFGGSQVRGARHT